MDSITHKHGETTLATIGYPSRDNAGNPLSMTDSVGMWSYGYDSNNRLVAAVPPRPVPEQPAGEPYEYDWVGNRIRPPHDPNPPSTAVHNEDALDFLQNSLPIFERTAHVALYRPSL